MQLWSITPYMNGMRWSWRGEGGMRGACCAVYANFIIALKMPVTSAQACCLALCLSPSLSLCLSSAVSLFSSHSIIPCFLFFVVTFDFYLTKMGLHCFLLGTFTGLSVNTKWGRSRSRSRCRCCTWQAVPRRETFQCNGRAIEIVWLALPSRADGTLNLKPNLAAHTLDSNYDNDWQCDSE